MVAAASRSWARRPLYLAAFAGSLSAGPIVSALLDALLATTSSYRNAFLALAAVSLLSLVIILVCKRGKLCGAAAGDRPSRSSGADRRPDRHPVGGHRGRAATSWESATVIGGFMRCLVAFSGFSLSKDATCGVAGVAGGQGERYRLVPVDGGGALAGCR